MPAFECRNPLLKIVYFLFKMMGVVVLFLGRLGLGFGFFFAAFLRVHLIPFQSHDSPAALIM